MSNDLVRLPARSTAGIAPRRAAGIALGCARGVHEAVAPTRAHVIRDPRSQGRTGCRRRPLGFQLIRRLPRVPLPAGADAALSTIASARTGLRAPILRAPTPPPAMPPIPLRLSVLPRQIRRDSLKSSAFILCCL